MSAIVIIGTQRELLEGVVAVLEGAGFRVQLADGVESAAVLIVSAVPIAIIAERDLAAAEPEVFSLPVLPGGAFILYRTADDAAVGFSPGLARSVMAELTLPLEKQRLVALLQRLRERHRDRRGDIGGSTSPTAG